MTQILSLQAEIIGPFSAWPRRRGTGPVRMVAGSSLALGGAAAAAVFAHCVVPML